MSYIKKICVIGAGPSGLSVLRSFESDNLLKNSNYNITCYEKQSDWGGLWNYSWRTGTDKNGFNVHNSMYKHLWSNGPKECLEFPDYTFKQHFGKIIPSYPPREVLYDYIVGRLKKSNIKHLIKFNHVVNNVEYEPELGIFKVTTIDVEKNNDIKDLVEKMLCFLKDEKDKHYNKIFISKKNSKKYTIFSHYKNLNQLLQIG